MERIEDIFNRTRCGMGAVPEKVHISIPDSTRVLMKAFLTHFDFVKESFHKHPAYREIAEWLSDNEGKGLLLYGNCGQGKTLLARFIIPAIMEEYVKPTKVYNYYPMVDANRNVDEVKSHKIICLDDVGKEEQFMEYGVKRNSFEEIMDAVEQQGKLAIITTNLDKDELEARYGTRTVDRIIATCRCVCFNMCKHYYDCRYKSAYNSCSQCNHFENVSFRRK